MNAARFFCSGEGKSNAIYTIKARCLQRGSVVDGISPFYCFHTARHQQIHSSVQLAVERKGLKQLLTKCDAFFVALLLWSKNDSFRVLPRTYCNNTRPVRPSYVKAL